MTENNNLTGIPQLPEPLQTNPWQDSRDQIPGNTMRRLLDIIYLCPLCSELHQAQYYLTIAADTPEQFAEHCQTAFSDHDLAASLLTRNSQAHHQLAGDYQQRLSEPSGPTHGTILRFNILKEEAYTCDDCNTTFQSIAAYRLHTGVDTHTALPTPEGTGVPLCQPNPN